MKAKQIKELARKYYDLMFKAITDSSPKSMDRLEYETETLTKDIEELKPKEIQLLNSKMAKIAEKDDKCPHFMKGWLRISSMRPRTPTKKEEKLANDIMKTLKPKLKELDKEIYDSFVDSLKWRGEKNLTNMLNAVTAAKEKPKIKGRESCIFVQTDEDVYYVG